MFIPSFRGIRRAVEAYVFCILSSPTVLIFHATISAVENGPSIPTRHHQVSFTRFSYRARQQANKVQNRIPDWMFFCRSQRSTMKLAVFLQHRGQQMLSGVSVLADSRDGGEGEVVLKPLLASLENFSPLSLHHSTSKAEPVAPGGTRRTG